MSACSLSPHGQRSCTGQMSLFLKTSQLVSSPGASVVLVCPGDHRLKHYGDVFSRKSQVWAVPGLKNNSRSLTLRAQAAAGSAPPAVLVALSPYRFPGSALGCCSCQRQQRPLEKKALLPSISEQGNFPETQQDMGHPVSLGKLGYGNMARLVTGEEDVPGMVGVPSWDWGWGWAPAPSGLRRRCLNTARGQEEWLLGARVCCQDSVTSANGGHREVTEEQKKPL